MDFTLVFLVVLFALAVVGGAGLGIVAFFRLERMNRTIWGLQAEVGRLRERVGDHAQSAASEPAPEVASPNRPLPREAPASPAPDTIQSSEPAVVVPQPVPASAADAGGQLRWLEELAGGRLSVLLGGLALALGGIFTVRYTIEQGLLGPAARVMLGLALAVAMAAGGEYLRRTERQSASDDGRVAPAYIPGALTGAAIVTAFATVYAAYGLYGLIGPLTAFTLLAMCSFAGLAAAALHGPALAALGLLGSFATPLLVEGGRPDAWVLFGYLVLVTFACYLTAHLRRWWWLAIAASVAADVWVVLWQLSSKHLDAWAVAVYLALLATSAVLLLHREESVVAPEEDTSSLLSQLGLGAVDWPLTGILGGHALMAVLLAAGDELDAPALWALIAISAIYGWSAWSWRSLALAPAASGIAIVLSYGWPWLPSGLFGTAYPPGSGETWFAILFGLGYGLAGTAAHLDRRSNVVWASQAAAVPLVLFIEAYWLNASGQVSLVFGLIGAVLAIAYATAAEIEIHRPRTLLGDWVIGIDAAAAVAALALALAMVLEKGWLTVALAAMAPGLALIGRERPIPILRWLIGGLAAIVALRLLVEPGIVGVDPGRTPIFNWLLYAYGLPAVAFWYAGRELLRQRDDLPVKLAEGASIAFLAWLIGVEIRHVMHGGLAYSPWTSLGEYGLHTISWLGLAIGLRLRAGRDGGRLVPRYAALGFGALGIASMLGNTLFVQNPVFTGESVGSNRILNDLVLAYLLPAMLAGALFLLVRRAQPWWPAVVAGTAGLIMAFAYLTLEVARWFEGSVIAMSTLTEPELYTLSVVWLLFALTMLAAGIRFHIAALRQAAFGVLLLVTLKVFLVDLAGLTGMLQAGSLLGLGAALIGIGLAYQRLVLRAQPPAS